MSRSFFSIDFKLPDLGSGLYKLSEMVIRLDKRVDFDQMTA